jgi:protein O-mannosyl-transferase
VGVETMKAAVKQQPTLGERCTGDTIWSKRGGLEVIVCISTFLVYIGTLAFGFVYDDQPQIVQNPAVQAWHYVPRYFTSHVWADIYSGRVGNYYRPLFLLWLRLNHALFGLIPAWWHLTNLFCHVLVTYLVFRLAFLLTQNRGTAFVAGLLFGLHPVHIESVSWISGITDPLMAALFLASLLSCLQYFDNKEKGWLAIAVVAFGLALLVKETAIVLPLVILVCAWKGESAEQTEAVRRFGWSAAKVLFFFLITAAAYVLARSIALGGITHTTVPMSYRTMVLTWPIVMLFYMGHLIWPFGLSEFYPSPVVAQISIGKFLAPLSIILLAMLWVGFVVRWLRPRQATRCALALLVFPLLPALYLRGLNAGDLLHDRYLYLPSAGFAILLAMALTRLADTLAIRTALECWALVMLVVAGYTVATFAQEFQWANDRLLYRRGLESAPDNNTVRDNLANTFLATGEYEKALPLYLEVLRRDPKFWRSNYNLGFLYYKTGCHPEAELMFKRAIRIDPSDGDEFLYLAVVQMHLGSIEDAIANARRAVQLNPKGFGYHYTLGALLKTKGLHAEAANEFRLELMNNPQNASAARELLILQQEK